jgi:hypothetical protein
MLLLRHSDRGQDDAAKREASGGKRAYRGAKATHLFAFSIVALALS